MLLYKYMINTCQHLNGRSLMIYSSHHYKYHITSLWLALILFISICYFLFRYWLEHGRVKLDCHSRFNFLSCFQVTSFTHSLRSSIQRDPRVIFLYRLVADTYLQLLPAGHLTLYHLVSRRLFATRPGKMSHITPSSRPMLISNFFQRNFSPYAHQ